MKQAATLLGFDYGDKKIGVAVGQTLTGTASALGLIRVRSTGPDWDGIADLIETWQPDALVVGLPLNMDGTEQIVTRSARRFGRQLRGRFSLPVHSVDERLSTREACERLLRAGKAPQGNDSMAAQVILEDWLAENERAR